MSMSTVSERRRCISATLPNNSLQLDRLYLGVFVVLRSTEAVLAIRPGRPWPTQTRAWPTQTARVIPMIPTYTTPVVLPKIFLAFYRPIQMKIPRNPLVQYRCHSLASLYKRA